MVRYRHLLVLLVPELVAGLVFHYSQHNIAVASYLKKRMMLLPL